MSSKQSRPLRWTDELNHWVFWPPFLMLALAVALNLIDPGLFEKTVTGFSQWIVSTFGWLFTVCICAAIVLCAWIAVSPFGAARLGGKSAEPLMSRWNWFAIAICTSVATGILFWATAEPIFHYNEPSPLAGNIAPRSPAAAVAALSVLYLHWTITPYCIYAVVSLAFAWSYYNMGQPYSLRSMLAALAGPNRVDCPNRVDWLKRRPWVGNLVDGICLFALVAGMAATLGGGIMVIAGGLNQLAGVPRSIWVWLFIAAFIVVAFIVSSATGLMNGIRILSDLNAKALVILCGIVFLVGPTGYIIALAGEATWTYVSNFVSYNSNAGRIAGDAWSHKWSTFYWAVWLAWAPISGCFLGRIALGRTVREFLLFNLVLPAVFSLVWMSVFGATALQFQQTGVADLAAVAEDPNRGSEAVTYEVFSQLPFANLMAMFYLLSAIISFVTSADSNTSAMASISSRDVSTENPEGSTVVKVLWGICVGTVAWVMIAVTGGIDGIKMISVIGGFPAAILFFFVMVSLARITLEYRKFDATAGESDG